MVETPEDRAILIRDFGEPMTASGSRIGFVSFTGIFDNDHEFVSGQTLDFSLQRPRITCISSDVFGLVEGDTVNVRNSAYEVVVIMPDGTGITELTLEQQ